MTFKFYDELLSCLQRINRKFRFDSEGLYWKADTSMFAANPDDLWKYNFGTINFGTTISSFNCLTVSMPPLSAK